MTQIPSGGRRVDPPDDPALLDNGTDKVTGLVDRDTFLEVLQRRTEGRHGATLPFALLTLDLDGFAAIEATHGLALGGTLLAAVSRRLRQEIRTADVAARLEGDCFGVLMPDPSAESEANGMAARLVGLIRRPFVLDGRALAIGCSIGIALYPSDGWDQAGLMRCAMQAMRQAGREGGGLRRLITPRRPLAHPGWHRRTA